MFSMFEIRWSCGDEEMDVLFLKCINCKREKCLDSKTNFTWVYDEIVTKSFSNKMLHHVGMSWIISSNHEMEYKMDEHNHQDWLNKVPWYNTSICSKLHGSRFEDFIPQEIIKRYNLKYYLVAHDRLQLDYKDYESSIGDREIPDDATIKTLEGLGVTINFLDIWLKMLCEYINAMKVMFRQIPLTIKIELTHEKNPKTYDSYWWWMVH